MGFLIILQLRLPFLFLYECQYTRLPFLNYFHDSQIYSKEDFLIAILGLFAIKHIKFGRLMALDNHFSYENNLKSGAHFASTLVLNLYEGFFEMKLKELLKFDYLSLSFLL